MTDKDKASKKRMTMKEERAIQNGLVHYLHSQGAEGLITKWNRLKDVYSP